MVPQNRSYQIIASFLVLLVSFSSLGLTVQAHYCMDRLQGISLVGKAKSCHERAQQKACHSKMPACPLHQKQQEQKECCDDQVIVMDADLDLIPSQLVELSLVDQDFLMAFAWSSIASLETCVAPSPYQNYKPPLLDRDICVLVQSFLL